MAVIFSLWECQQKELARCAEEDEGGGEKAAFGYVLINLII